MAEQFSSYHRASTEQDREAAYRIWREIHYEPYRLAVLEKAKPDDGCVSGDAECKCIRHSKQYKAALRSEDEIRATWFKRYQRPAAPF